MCGWLGIFLGIGFGIALAVSLAIAFAIAFASSAFHDPNHFTFLLGWLFGCGRKVFANFFNFVSPS